MNIFAYLKNDDISFQLTKDNTIGRNPLKNSICINHQSISKQHCQINYDENDSCFYLIDNSSNGTFLNGRRVEQEKKIQLKENDVLRFGKDHTMYKLLFNSFKDNRSISLVDDLSKTKGEHFANIENPPDSALPISQINQSIRDNDYKLLNAKFDACMSYASEMVRKNDRLEKEIKEKETLIEILRNENSFNEMEIRKIKQCVYTKNDEELKEKIDLLFNEYLKLISDYKKINDEYRAQSKTVDRKWNDLIEENKSLKGIISKINAEKRESIEECSILVSKSEERYSQVYNELTERYKENISQRKKEAAEFLGEQVKIILNEKNELLNQYNKLYQENSKLKEENEKYRMKLTRIDEGSLSELEIKNGQLKDKIIQLESFSSPEKLRVYEKLIVDLNTQIGKKDFQIKSIENQEIMENIGSFQGIRSSNNNQGEREGLNNEINLNTFGNNGITEKNPSVPVGKINGLNWNKISIPKTEGEPVNNNLNTIRSISQSQMIDRSIIKI